LSLTIEHTLTAEEKISDHSAFTSLFREALLKAHELNASDIHIEPSFKELLIRIRVNGDLFTFKSLEKDYQLSFIQEVKRLCNLSIAISNRPQDTRVTLPSWNLALRVNSTPTLFGEKIVLRLLDMRTSFNIDDTGLDKSTKDQLLKAAQVKNGVLIVSGPTGSGKTRTLFSLLNSLDKKKKNIVTLEDPVEYTFEGINQIEIKSPLTFADGLRAILRQDPDIILVGEIRDFETADLCFKAAATGHLVISTLHANSAAKAIERLKNMGVDEYMIESNLNFSAAQRLVQKLCPHCSVKVSKDEVIKILGQEIEGIFRKKGQGSCHHCKGNGVSGRLPIMEHLSKNDFQSGKSSKGLRDHYLDLAKTQIVDITEVMNYE
jgi:type II secretory ATPase GspE/PulE/Tfp pilus assembly ATPase PilB-like protein